MIRTSSDLTQDVRTSYLPSMPANRHRRPPGEVRDAVLKVLQAHPSGASVGEIVAGVRDRIGEVPESSIRSYLRLNTPRLFVRPQRGHYRLSEVGQLPGGGASDGKGPDGRLSVGESVSDGGAPARRRFRTRVFGRASVVHADCMDSMWEPWLVFRKPLEGRVQDNLRRWRTGGFRRPSPDRPFGDVIRSSPTRKEERSLAPHPSLKPQGFLRPLVRGVLPLGEGVVLDPFCGAGSTLAAAEAVGYRSIGIESDPEYFSMACRAIPRLATYRREQAEL